MTYVVSGRALNCTVAGACDFRHFLLWGGSKIEVSGAVSECEELKFGA